MSTWLWKADMFPSLSLGMVAFIFLQIRIPSKSHLCCFSSKFRSSTNMKFCVQFKPLIQIWKVSHRGGSQLAPWVTQFTLKIQGGNSADLFFFIKPKTLSSTISWLPWPEQPPTIAASTRPSLFSNSRSRRPAFLVGFHKYLCQEIIFSTLYEFVRLVCQYDIHSSCVGSWSPIKMRATDPEIYFSCL